MATLLSYCLFHFQLVGLPTALGTSPRKSLSDLRAQHKADQFRGERCRCFEVHYNFQVYSTFQSFRPVSCSLP